MCANVLPERETGPRRWTDKPAETETAFRNNRRRVRRDKGKRLQRARSELLERSFAHVCETSGARRTWLRGLEKINKRYQIHTAARNLDLLMRDLFGIGKPRVLQDGWEALEEAAAVLSTPWTVQIAAWWSPPRARAALESIRHLADRNRQRASKLAAI